MHQFYRFAAVSPALAPGDFAGNLKSLKKCYAKAIKQGAGCVVFPEFAVCGDRSESMMRRSDFLGRCRETAEKFAAATTGTVALFGTVADGQSAVAVAQNGELLALIPAGETAIFSWDENFSFAAGSKLADGINADAVLLCGAEPFAAGKRAERTAALTGYSAATGQAVIFANAGSGISTTDHVGDGDALIAVDGKVKARTAPFAENEMIFADVDFGRIAFRREQGADWAECIPLDDLPQAPDLQYAAISRDPFRDEAGEDLDLIVEGAAHALSRRMQQIHAKCLVIGISGGLDSTMALITCARACDQLKISRENVRALTMPGFGTTDRTHDNAQTLCRELGVSLTEINISKACRQHLAAIGHDGKTPDAAYENSQARERTQILMDYANLNGGIVVGTGDLSELALGWCTYNGDQMSMYGVNATIPKTLMRHILDAEADRATPALASAIRDVLATPVSPELLPAQKGKKDSVQQTENILGPYELHDFFLYHFVSGGADQEKLLAMAQNAFQGIFADELIRHTLERFLQRLFSQQFKRNPSPDAPQLTSISLSPRGGWHVPGDWVK